MLILRNDQCVKVWAVGKDGKGNRVSLDGDVAWDSSDNRIAQVRGLPSPQAPDPANQRSADKREREGAFGAEILAGDELGTCQINVRGQAGGEELHGTIEVKVVTGTVTSLVIEPEEAQSAIVEQPPVTPPPGGPVHFKESEQRPGPRKKEF